MPKPKRPTRTTAETTAPKVVFFLSDLHCLSTYAVLRPGFKTIAGNEIGLNPIQAWLWKAMQECLFDAHRLRGRDPFSVVLNGDLIEGNHHRTKEILAVDELEHAAAAVWTLEPIVKGASKVFVTDGTECHTGNFENGIAKEIGAEKCPWTGGHSFNHLPLEVNGCFGIARHHMPTTSRVYLEAGALSIMLGNAQLSRIRAGEEPPKWIVSAHRHREGIYQTASAMHCVCPAWQALTRHGNKVVPDGVLTCGILVLDFRNRPSGSLPTPHLITRTLASNRRVRL